MIKHYIDIDDAWGVIFIYGFGRSDIDEMIAIMDSFGMRERQIDEALDVLFDINTGMTISRADLRMSVVFIGKQDSIEQFADSVTHEIDHIQDAICDYYDVPLGSERAAWTQGYIARGIMRALAQNCE